MDRNDVEKLLNYNADMCNNLHAYVTAYVEWVRDNVDKSEFWIHFGVADFMENSRCGAVLGFEGDDERIYPLNWGAGYHLGGDFECWVPGTSEKMTIDFAKRIPGLIENGLKKIQQFNDDVAEILKSKVEFISKSNDNEEE